MRSLFKFAGFAGCAALAAAMSGLVMDRLAPAAGGTTLPSSTLLNGLIAASAGLALGLIVAWFRRIPWAQLRARFTLWRSGLGRQLWWAAAGCVSLAVIIFY